FVFNYPEGDSVYLYPGRTYSVSDLRRSPQLANRIKRAKLPVISRPVDKKDHYVKRCGYGQGRDRHYPPLGS
ncbi:MAG: hypothetical protein AAFP19_02430, partial [Bacteroidota bacterium]